MNVRLSFNDGYAEKPIYSIKAVTSEKHKGFDMIDLIMDNFNIISPEIKEHREIVKIQLMEEMNNLPKRVISPHLMLSRDKKGNLVSPFASGKKLI